MNLISNTPWMSKKCIGQLYKYENIYRIEEDYAEDHEIVYQMFNMVEANIGPLANVQYINVFLM